MRRWIFGITFSLAWLAFALPLSGGAKADPELLDLEGERVHLTPPIDQEVVIIHFWATWCPSCLLDLEAFSTAVSECVPGRISAYLVNVAEDDSVVRAFVESHPLKIQVLRDPKGHSWRETRARGLPTNLYWTAKGREVEIGPRSLVDWQRQLAEAGCSRTRSPKDQP